MAELLQNWVRLQAEMRPDSIAVVGDRSSITYSQLEMRSNQLAWVLRESGCKRGDRIGLLIPKSIPAVVGLLGIYKADCIYVPLDPSGPPERIANILRSCECKLVLGGWRAAELFDRGVPGETLFADFSMGWIDTGRAPPGNRIKSLFTLEETSNYPANSPHFENKGDDPAHILFTSGSTGKPKGVVITHRNVIEFVEWAVSYFGIDSSDRNSGHPPFPFDLSFMDIFGTFAAGAELHLAPTELNVSPKSLASFIRDRKLTQWFSVPSVLHFLAKFDALGHVGLPDLKRVLWCGEVFPLPSLVYWMKRVPHAKFTNLYGPTETTIASSYYTVPRCPETSAPIPIGTACNGEELMVLDERMMRVAPGQVGELCIRGSGVSQGYWNDPEGTRNAFVSNPHGSDPNDRIYKTGDLAMIGTDNLVYFLGRNDSQIKSRGYRIELGEIEAALSTIESIKENAVVAITNGDIETVIICCAYAVQGSGCSPLSLRSSLSRMLPNYMLPIRWRLYDSLPKNASGKIDRRSLKEEFLQSEHAGHKGAYIARHIAR